jgi:hypothetical protein
MATSARHIPVKNNPLSDKSNVSKGSDALRIHSCALRSPGVDAGQNMRFGPQQLVDQ